MRILEKNIKIKKTLKIALFVSLASLIKLDFIADGFIIATSVLIMAIFIYCYEDLSALYIACCAGIFSPVFRLVTLLISSYTFKEAVVMAVPDMIYFFSYGIIYTFIYGHIVRTPKDSLNFPAVVFCTDLFSNIIELLSRSIVLGEFLTDFNTIGFLMILVFCRTLLLQMILVAMEAYSGLLLRKEHEKEYYRLIKQASVFESELHIMEKNLFEIEDIMRKSYRLYQSMGKLDIPENIKQESLEVAKNAHEIKGDYLNIIRILTDTFVNDFKKGPMKISDIIAIEKANILSEIKEKNYNISLNIQLKCDFYITLHFKMMSVLRNLLLNAVEAIGSKSGIILLELYKEEDKYILKIRDNGTGIEEDELEDIFLDGYSTKFNSETGNMQRGIGLAVVKDYVENDFQGEICVNSEKGIYTEFIIKLPEKSMEGGTQNELLFT